MESSFIILNILEGETHVLLQSRVSGRVAVKAPFAAAAIRRAR
jgi:hypothetical protein